MNDSFLELKKNTQSIYPLSEASFKNFAQIFQPFEAKRKVILTHEGSVEQYVYFVLERQIELQSLSAEDRFRTLLKRRGHVLDMIPHKYLASYLGMDATNFSKLLGTVKVWRCKIFDYNFL